MTKMVKKVFVEAKTPFVPSVKKEEKRIVIGKSIRGIVGFKSTSL